MLEGRLTFDQWQDQQTGQNRSKHTLRVDNMKMLGSKNEQTAPHNTSINQNDKPPFDVQQTQQNTTNQVINEKEIPNFDAIPEDPNISRRDFLKLKSFGMKI